MRCQFCGWDNPEGRTKCEKCNKPLSNGSNHYVAEPSNNMPVSARGGKSGRPTQYMGQPSRDNFNPKATVLEPGAIGHTLNENVNAAEDTCPKCGYPMERGVCPSCGYSTKNETASDEATFGQHEAADAMAIAEARKTIRPVRKGPKEGNFVLTPLSETTGLPEGESISYEGNAVVLNRHNTDPKNATITSHEQALVSYENGAWGISDKSEMKTTFVQADERIALHDGSIILIGNQLYRFEVGKQSEE